MRTSSLERYLEANLVLWVGCSVVVAAVASIFAGVDPVDSTAVAVADIGNLDSRLAPRAHFVEVEVEAVMEGLGLELMCRMVLVVARAELTSNMMAWAAKECMTSFLGRM